MVEVMVASPGLAQNLLGDPGARPVWVYLPPPYDRQPEARFPVIYLLHGFGVEPRFWKDGGPPGRKIDLEARLNALLQQGKLPPVIVVMPSAKNAYGGSFYLNSPVTGKWEDFIAVDLVHYIDTHFRTQTTKQRRALAGHSMGGYGALWLGARHPDRFGAVYALSPACLDFSEHFLKRQRDDVLAAMKVRRRELFPQLPWRQQVVIAAAAAVAPNPDQPPFLADFPFREEGGPPILDEAIWQRWLTCDPYSQLPAWRDNLARLHLALDMGTQDPLRPQARRFSAALQALGIPHEYAEYEGDHSNRLPERLQEQALPWLLRHLNN